MFRNNSSILSLLVVLLACLGVLGSPSYRTFNKRSQVAARNPDAETWSNAERLARGLSPRKPGTLFNPTRVARTVPQPSGVQPVTGNIEVRKTSNSQSLGYVRSNLDDGRYTLTSGGNRVSIKFTPNSGPFQIEINNSPDYPYLGFAGSSSLSSSNGNTVSVVKTNSVSSGSTPKPNGNSFGGSSESYVWFYNTGTGELTAQWVNPGSGSVVNVYFYYDSNTGLYASANNNLNSLTRVRFFRV